MIEYGKTYDEYKEIRKKTMMNATKKTKVLKRYKAKGDTKCGMCGIDLTSYSYSTGNYRVSTEYFHLVMTPLFYIDLCQEPTKCYKNYKKAGQR